MLTWLLLIVPKLVCGNGDPSFLWGSATASYQVEGAYDEDGRGTAII